MKRAHICLLTVSLGLTLTAALAANEPTAQQARDLYKQGKYAEAQRAFEAVISAKRNAEVKEQRQYAELLLGYGRSLAASGKFSEAFQMVSQAMAIADAFALPGDFKNLVKADLESIRPRISPPNDQVFHSYNYSGPNDHDSAEREYLCKAAIEFAKERYGTGSMSYLLRHIDYARFLSEQQRRDDLSKEAAACREIFSKLPANYQGQTAPQVLEFAQTLASSNLPLDADTVGSIVMDNIMQGDIRNGLELATHLERLASALDRDQSGELAQKYYAASVRAFEKHLPPDDPRLATMRSALAAHYKKVGKNGAAIELLEMSVAAQAKNIATGSPTALNALAGLTELYCLTSNVEKAKECAQKLAQALARTPDDSNVRTQSLFDAAELLASKGDIASAESIYTATFDAMKQRRGNQWERDLDRETKQLAAKLGSQGHPELAEKFYDAYIASRSTSLGQPTAQSLNATIEKATFFIEQQVYDKANAAAMAALELSKRFTGNQDYRLNELARQFYLNKQYETALKLELAWLDSVEGSHNIGEYQIAEAKSRVMNLYHHLGRDDEAAQVMREMTVKACSRLAGKAANAVPILNQALEKLVAAKKFDSAAELMQTLGQISSYSQPTDAFNRVTYILTQAQLLDESQQIVELALEIHSGNYGPSSSQAANLLREYGRILSMKGETAKAQEMYKSAEAIFALQRKQQQTNPGGTDIYNPKAPLADTVKAAGDLGLRQPGGVVLRHNVVDLRRFQR